MTRPLGRFEVAGRATLVIHFVDAETPRASPSPRAARAARSGPTSARPPPADATGYTFLALDTRTPYTGEVAVPDGGKTAHDVLRWQNAKGETGPWSEVVSAKIRA